MNVDLCNNGVSSVLHSTYIRSLHTAQPPAGSSGRTPGQGVRPSEGDGLYLLKLKVCAYWGRKVGPCVVFSNLDNLIIIFVASLTE